MYLDPEYRLSAHDTEYVGIVHVGCATQISSLPFEYARFPVSLFQKQQNEIWHGHEMDIDVLEHLHHFSYDVLHSWCALLI